MKLTNLSVGAVTAVIALDLHLAFRPIPSGAAKAVLWVIAAGLLAMFLSSMARTARRLKTADLEESRRAIFALGLAALVLVVLALSVPEVVRRLTP